MSYDVAHHMNLVMELLLFALELQFSFEIQADLGRSRYVELDIREHEFSYKIIGFFFITQ